MDTLDDARTAEAFDTVRKYVRLYGAVCAITLATVVVVAICGGPVSAFMVIRAVILPAIAPVLYRMAGRAAGGEQRSRQRLRTLTVVLPVAIVAVDLIPGVCPPWYAGLQAVAALALVGAAVFIRRAASS